MTSADNDNNDNERDASRVHGLEPVQVYAGKNSTPVTGVIKNISETGTHIRIVDAESFPERVYLSSSSIGEKRPALVRWRDETNIGVHFDEPLLD